VKLASQHHLPRGDGHFVHRSHLGGGSQRPRQFAFHGAPVIARGGLIEREMGSRLQIRILGPGQLDRDRGPAYQLGIQC
jgi:hypothetical protein